MNTRFLGLAVIAILQACAASAGRDTSVAADLADTTTAQCLCPDTVSGSEMGDRDAVRPITYTWVDKDGIRVYSDSVPPDDDGRARQVPREPCVQVDRSRDELTAEELKALCIAAELEWKKELQRRADQALVKTFDDIDELSLYRDRLIKKSNSQQEKRQDDLR